MASTLKTIGPNDVISSRTLLHESIPITGTIVSGTYAEANIQDYSHGMFQTVYDYPYLSSSANHIFDISLGLSSESLNYAAATVQKSKKLNIYNQMAQLLAGYDVNGNIRRFDADGNYLAGGAKIDDAVFVSFSRLLVKDEIKKESFQMVVGLGNALSNPWEHLATITDYDAVNNYKVNSPAGEFGVLYVTSSTAGAIDHAQASLSTPTGYLPCGLIYYQAGILVLTSSLFLDKSEGGFGGDGATLNWYYANEWNDSSKTEEISGSAIGLRARISNISFNNTTELNSTIYFCRANHNEFNYSANPTYLTGSKIKVKNQSTDTPLAYITTVGLYSADNQLLAVGKLSEPLRKDPTIEYTLRARLDY